jgi:hypothetical protein
VAKNILVKDAIQKMGLGGYTKLHQSLASRQTAAGGIALFKASQIHAPPKNLLLQQYVPPIVAPLKQAQILTLLSPKGSVQQCKKCVYFPYFKFEARFCGGTKHDGCWEVNKGESPPWDRILDEKQKR